MEITARQTRRNTQALGSHVDEAKGLSTTAQPVVAHHHPVSSSGSQAPAMVMDPWKDDRLRDFIAINVQTRVRSFHLQPGRPLADPGSQNAQRAVQLLLLPRTDATCDGKAADCPLRRTFCRIFGTSLLRHETHASYRPPPLSPNHRMPTPLSLETPLQHDHRDEGGSAESNRRWGILSSPAPAPLLSESRASVGPDGVAQTEHPDVAPSMPAIATPERQRLNSNQPAASSQSFSHSMPLTMGSATPRDFLPELEHPCCEECVESICTHYQNLLNRGVIADRFSQRDLLFAHWVLFKNMEGSTLDPHATVGRKEALSITIKSGYYNLLKIPKAPPAVSPTPPVIIHPTQVTAALTLISKADEGAAKKRRRGEAPGTPTDHQAAPQPDVVVEPPATKGARKRVVEVPSASSSVNPLRNALKQDVDGKTYVTRRSAASETITAPAAIAAPIKQEEQETVATPLVSPSVVRRRKQQRGAADVSAPGTLSQGTAIKKEEVEPVAITAHQRPQPQAPSKPLQATKEVEQSLRFLLGDDILASQRESILFAGSHTSCSSRAADPRQKQGSNVFDEEARLLVVDEACRASVGKQAAPSLASFTFGQQCLVLLAASRMMDPQVAVGPQFHPKLACIGGLTHREALPYLDYWVVEGQSPF